MGKYFSTGEVCLMEAGVTLDGYVGFDIQYATLK